VLLHSSYSYALNPFAYEDQRQTASSVTSFKFLNNNGTEIEVFDLSSPIHIFFPISAIVDTSLAIGCYYWNDTLQQWSTEGVSVVSQFLTNITCSSTHLTDFAVLTQVPPTDSNQLLHYIYIGSVVAAVVIAIVITIIVVQVQLRKRRRRRLHPVQYMREKVDKKGKNLLRIFHTSYKKWTLGEYVRPRPSKEDSSYTPTDTDKHLSNPIELTLQGRSSISLPALPTEEVPQTSTKQVVRPPRPDKPPKPPKPLPSQKSTDSDSQLNV